MKYQLLLHGIHALLALPFLPPGRGGLILIFGGLAMLATALFLLMLAPASVPAGANAASGIVGQAAAMQHGARESTHRAPVRMWHKAVCARAQRSGLRHLEVREADALSCVVIVGECASCRKGRPDCRREQKKLHRAARRLSRTARVEEVCCSIRGQSRCAFAIDMGR